jgi:hypothetical protein
MYDETIVDGWLGSIDTPNWDPLESFLPLVLCSGFMWMNSIELENGSELHAYKHRLTRRYLHLDNEADAWESLDRGRYRRMRHSDAIEQASAHALPSGRRSERVAAALASCP